MKIKDLLKRSIALNIKRARIAANMTQAEAAEKLGITAQAISNFERGINAIESSLLCRMCEVYNTSMSAICCEEDVFEDISESGSTTAIPFSPDIQPMPKMKRWTIIGGTACGDPIYKDLDGERVIAPADIDADFVFRCVGDSMINARIFDGDIVFVKSGIQVEEGQIAVVRIGEEYTLKRIFRGPDYLELRSENPMFPTRIIRGEQENAEIVGRAVHFLSRVI